MDLVAGGVPTLAQSEVNTIATAKTDADAGAGTGAEAEMLMAILKMVMNMLGPSIDYNAGNIEDIRSTINLSDGGKLKIGKWMEIENKSRGILFRHISDLINKLIWYMHLGVLGFWGALTLHQYGL